MIEYFKKLGSHTIVYGLGDMAVKMIAFLLIPLYTRNMTTEMYGVYDILQTIQAILVFLLGLGFQSAIFKVYHESANEKEKNDTMATALITYLFWGIPVTGLLFVMAEPIAGLFFKNSTVIDNTEAVIYLRMVFGAVFFDLFRLMILSLFRAWEKPVFFIMVNIANFGLLLFLNILNVAVRDRGILGVMESQLITSTLVFVVMGLLVLRKIKYRFDFSKLKALLHFGLPLVPSGVSAWSLSMTGRYFLHFYHSDHEVGLYGLAWRFGIIINMLLGQPFRTAWLPFLFSIQKEKNAQRVYSLTQTYFFTGGMFLFLVVSVLAREIVTLAAPGPYLEAYRIIPLIAAAYLCYGLFNTVDVGILLSGKTKYYAIVGLITAGFQIGLYFILVPRGRVMGTAVGTLLSYFFLFIMIFIISQRLHPIRYEWSRLIKIVCCGVIVLAGYFVDSGSVWLNIIIKLAILLCFPVLLIITGFFTSQEKRAVSAWLGKRAHHRH